jgi:hypothetical protein
MIAFTYIYTDILTRTRIRAKKCSIANGTSEAIASQISNAEKF